MKVLSGITLLIMMVSIQHPVLLAQTPGQAPAPPSFEGQELQIEGAHPVTPQTEYEREHRQKEKPAIEQSLVSKATQPPVEIETNSLYYYEPGFSRYYQGYFVDDKTFALNDKKFTLYDWTLSFFPIKGGAYRSPRFEINALHTLALKMVFREGATEVLQCHIDFYQNIRPTGCELPSTIDPSRLTIEIDALTTEGITYKLKVGLTQGLNETYLGTFSLEHLSAVSLSQYPYQVGYMADNNWFTFISPMNDRFQLIFDFQGQQIILNISTHEALPNYVYMPPLREEAPTRLEGYPFTVKIYSPRRTVDLAFRVDVEAALRYLSGKEAAITDANIFPLIQARLTFSISSFSYLALHLDFEQSLHNSLSTSSLLTYTSYDAQMRFRYAFDRLWSHPTLIVGLGFYEVTVQDRAFAGAFLPRAQGFGGYIGADANIFHNFHLRPGFFYAFLKEPATINTFYRPEVGLAYEFNPHLAVEAHWKYTVYERSFLGTRSGQIHDFGLFLRYSL